MTTQSVIAQDATIQMESYRVSEITLRRNGKIGEGSLVNEYAYNMKCDDEKKTCTGNIVIQVYPDGYENNIAESPLYIKIDLTGKFALNDSVDHNVLSVETFRELFPYARALVTNITSSAGMTPMILPAIKVKPDDIKNEEV